MAGDGGPFPGPDAFALQAEVDRLNAELDVVRTTLTEALASGKAAATECEQLRAQTAAAVAEVNRVARETAVFHEMRRLVLLHGDEERKRRNHEFDEQLAGLVEGGGQP